LKRLEINTRIVDISEIHFSGGEDNFYEFQVEAHTYWTGDIAQSAGTAN